MEDSVPSRGRILLEVIATLTKVSQGALQEVQLSPTDYLSYYAYYLPDSPVGPPMSLIEGVAITSDKEVKEGSLRARFDNQGWRDVPIETIWSILHNLPTSRLSRVLEKDVV